MPTFDISNLIKQGIRALMSVITSPIGILFVIVGAVLSANAILVSYAGNWLYQITGLSSFLESIQTPHISLGNIGYTVGYVTALDILIRVIYAIVLSAIYFAISLPQILVTLFLASRVTAFRRAMREQWRELLQ